MIKKIAYAAIGFSGSALLIANMLVSMPDAYVASNANAAQTEPGEAPGRPDGLPYWSETEDGETVRDGDLSMPKLFNTYHVSPQDMADMTKKAVVTFGRNNPMGYWKKTEAGEKSSVTFNWDDVVKQADAGEGNTLGYNTSADAVTENKQIVPVATSEITATFKEYAVLPVDEKHFNVSSPFGPRVDPLDGKQDVFHGGLDIASTTIDRTNIYSVLPGTVSFVGNSATGYGNYIIINHGEFETLYSHMAELPTLKVGAVVQAGDKLGQVGSTGRSTGPHLHFEVVVNDVKVDPKPFLDLAGKPGNRNEPKQKTTTTTPVDTPEKSGTESEPKTVKETKTAGDN